jgi:dTDP-4-dehydrorhamnose reductase
MKVLVTGAEGMLGRSLLAVLASRAYDAVPCTRRELDITDAQRVRDIVVAERPDAVVQCAAYTRVDDAERAQDLAFRVNALGTRHVALACRSLGTRLVYPSSDYVFAGSAQVPYPPDAPTNPLNAYGRSKLAGEAAAGEAGDALIVRTSWLFAAHGRNFVRTILERGRAGQTLRVVDDQHGAPTSSNDLASMILQLLEASAAAGVYHATNRGVTTWFGFARAALELAGITADVVPVSSSEFVQPALRPSYSVLDCSATYALVGPAPHWSDALSRVISPGVPV